jgi:hypothetical protein
MHLRDIHALTPKITKLKNIMGEGIKLSTGANSPAASAGRDMKNRKCIMECRY